MSRRSGALLIAMLAWGLALPALTARAAEVPSIQAELSVPGWWVIGPFLSGVREAGPDPLAYEPDVPGFKSPLLAPGFPSVLVPGGEARWRYYPCDKDHAISVNYPEVPDAAMKLVTDEWGGAGGETVGLAYAKLHVDGGPYRALMELKQAGSVSINGVPWPGDPYGNGMGLTPVLLNDGDNELKVGVGSTQHFSLRFLPVTDSLIAFPQSATLPDLARGGVVQRSIGLPVANTTTQWITIRSEAIEPEYPLGKVKQYYTVRIAPLCVYNLALVLNPAVERLPADFKGDSLPITVSLGYSVEDGEANSRELKVDLKLRVRDFSQSRKLTFVSMDDLSVQYYAVLLPSSFDPKKEYGLILTLHGAGVEASGQVDAYQPKDWAFVVAPTNRRPFGFDWQDWGQQDMLEVLHDIEHRVQIDKNRVHLTGHSMGGHGVWLNAFTNPDLWASAAPSAGWTRFDLYAPMFLRRNLLYGEPYANYIWQLGMRGDDTLALAENALNLPIFALEGGSDDNVPPQQPRLLVEQLKHLGYDVTYKEVPGMGHWWDDPATPGVDCVDCKELNDFWKSHVRNPCPKEVVYRAAGPAPAPWTYWVHIYSALKMGEDITVRVVVHDRHSIEIKTTNVDMLRLDLSNELVDMNRVELLIDGQRLEVSPLDNPDAHGRVLLRVKNGKWRETSILSEKLPGKRSQIRQGPWKQVLRRPLIVYGTAGTKEDTAWNLQMARLYAYQWWYRANGRVDIVRDEEYLAKPPDRNVIAIGGVETNKVVAKLTDLLPIKPAPGGLQVGDRLIRGTDLTYKYVFPLPRGIYGERVDDVRYGFWLVLIEGGTSLSARKRLPAMMAIYSGAGFPDWMVWGDEVKLKGLGGVHAMGFFNLDWQLDPELSYFNEDLINRAP